MSLYRVVDKKVAWKFHLANRLVLCPSKHFALLQIHNDAAGAPELGHPQGLLLC